MPQIKDHPKKYLIPYKFERTSQEYMGYIFKNEQEYRIYMVNYKDRGYSFVWVVH